MQFMVYLILSLFSHQSSYFTVSKFGRNRLMQIIPKYSIYDYNKNLDNFRYGSKERKIYKNKNYISRKQ